MVQLSMTLSEACLKMENLLAGDDILLLLSLHFCNSHQLERTILQFWTNSSLIPLVRFP